MKRFCKILCCLLALVLLLSACGTGKGPAPATEAPTGNSEPATEPTTEERAEPIVLVRADGTPNCTVTKPKNASDATLAAVEKFLTDFRKAFLGIVHRRKDGDQTLDANRDGPGDDREEDVDQRGDDRVERTADDDANGHVEDIAPRDEGFEVGQMSILLEKDISSRIFEELHQHGL